MINNKKYIMPLFLLMAPSWLFAAESKSTELFNGSFSGSMKFATDYVFRGESEVNDSEIPAVQATLTWTHSNGTYAGVFGSTNKFASTPDIYAVIAPYVGKSGVILDSTINYNIFVFHYMYPGADSSDYTELWMKVGKSFGSMQVDLEVTPTLNDWFGVKGWSGVNYAVHPSNVFDNGVTLSGSIGYQELDGEGAQGWTHWNVGLSNTIWGLTWDVRYHDTNIDSAHKVYGSPAGLKIFDERFVFAVSKSF
ncbi:MAG: hypothetical protein ACI9LM_002877 [Alteromonadaceae bacterium]|jgi:uncharacterized protein (TIGR02001 family)